MQPIVYNYTHTSRYLHAIIMHTDTYVHNLHAYKIYYNK